MTRINAGIEPHELCDQHLNAEYRELPRIRVLAINHEAARNTPQYRPLPSYFSLNAGHMRFFIDKGRWLERRWEALCEEKRYRGFACNLYWRPWPASLNGDWDTYDDGLTAQQARGLLIERIRLRMPPQARWTKRMAPEWALRKELTHV